MRIPVVPIATIVSLATGMLTVALAATDDAESKAGIAYFETHIRPVLVESCYIGEGGSSRRTCFSSTDRLCRSDGLWGRER